MEKLKEKLRQEIYTELNAEVNTVKEIPKEETRISAVRPNCKMTVCEDPKTGEIKLTYGKGCPTGFIERVAGKIATRGIAFESGTLDEEEIGKE